MRLFSWETDKQTVHITVLKANLFAIKEPTDDDKAELGSYAADDLSKMLGTLGAALALGFDSAELSEDCRGSDLMLVSVDGSDL